MIRSLKVLAFFALASGILCLSACGKTPAPTEAPETAQPQATGAPFQASSAFAAPCIDAPYDHTYQDADKQILIRRFSTGDMTYFIADVQLTDPALLHTALSGDQANGALEPLSAMAQRCGAVLAVNADDYGVHKYGTIIRNGELIRAHDTTRSMLIVDQNGDLSVHADRANEDVQALSQSLLDANAWQTFEFGPELVRGGQAVDPDPVFDLISTDPRRRDPRTVIGQIGPLHYVLLVADGRQSVYSKGMTLDEAQRLMLDLGAQTAMNLDGGGSSELWFMGEILNRPSQGRERPLSDILYF